MKNTNYNNAIKIVIDFLNSLEDILIPMEGPSKELFINTPKNYKSALLGVLMIDNKFKEDFLVEIIRNYLFYKNISDDYLLSFKNLLKNSYLTIAKVFNNENGIKIYDMFLNKSYYIENKDFDFKDNKCYFLRVSYSNANIEFKKNSTRIDYSLDRKENYILSSIKELDEIFALEITNSFNESIGRAKIFIDNIRDIDKIYFSNAFSLNIFADVIDPNSTLNLKRIVKIINEMEYFINNIFNRKDQEIFLSYLNQKDIPSKIFDIFTNIYSKLFLPNKINISQTESYDFSVLISKNNPEKLANSREEFKNIIFSFKEFVVFASKIDSKFNKTLNEIDNVINNIFIYTYSQKNSLDNFYFDNALLTIIKDDYDNDFLNDFETFIHLIDSLDIIFSKTDNKLTPASIKYLENIMNLVPIKETKTKKQHLYPILDIYYNFCLTKKLIKFDSDGYDLTSKSAQFLELDKYKQLSIFIEFLINEFHTRTLFNESYLNYDKFLDIINILLEYNFIGIKDFEDYISYFNVFVNLGLIKYVDTKIFLTDFGKRLFEYYFDKKDNVIFFTDYMGV